MGHCVSRPQQIHVTVRDDCVVLSGSVPADEVAALIRVVKRVRGVPSVKNQLELQAADNASSHQATPTCGGPLMELTQENWTPGIRLMAIAAGMSLMTNCAMRKKPSALLWGTIGLGLVVRGMTNQPLTHLLGGQPTRPTSRQYQEASVEKHPGQGHAGDGEAAEYERAARASG
jgi:hypothetical protein